MVNHPSDSPPMQPQCMVVTVTEIYPLDQLLHPVVVWRYLRCGFCSKASAAIQVIALWSIACQNSNVFTIVKTLQRRVGPSR